MITCVRLLLQSPRAGGAPPLVAELASEFPTIDIALACDPCRTGLVKVAALDWCSPRCDFYAFDRALSAFESMDGTLDVEGAMGEVGLVALQVLTRYQRFVQRRNAASRTVRFSSLMARHRRFHDLSKPLVRADFDHALDVWQWVLRLSPQAGLALQCAALFHDIERLVSEPDVRVEQHAADYTSFKVAHARAGAAMASRALEEAGVDRATRDRVAQLIERHERPPVGSCRDAELITLHDADTLSFFALNSPGFADYYGQEHTKKKVAYTLSRMSAAARARIERLRLRADVARAVAAARSTSSSMGASP